MVKEPEVEKDLSNFLEDERERWGKVMKPMWVKMRSRDPHQLIELQAEAASQRHICSDEIALFLKKLSGLYRTVKQKKRDQFFHYGTGFGLKLTKGEKDIFTEADCKDFQYDVELVEAHVEFLRDMKSNLDGIRYSVKNIVQIWNILE